MSPGNSYFKPSRIRSCIELAQAHYEEVFIWIPDKPAIHTYRALGYPPNQCEAKARQKGNTLRNHCLAHSEETVKMLSWERDIDPLPSYQKALQHLYLLYNHHVEFKHAVQEETRGVLEKYPHKSVTFTSASLDEGACYLLKEFAFLDISPILSPLRPLALVYHRRWPLFERFISGHFDQKVREIEISSLLF